MLPPPLLHALEAHLQTRVSNIRPISGGSINQAHLLQTGKSSFFVKWNQGEFAKPLFETEVLGLQILNEKGGFRTPRIHLQEESGNISFLLMEYIEGGIKNNNFWENFGHSLASLHRKSNPHFGLDHDNYIGRLPQSNRQYDSWVNFYREERLLPQIKMALDNGRISTGAAKIFDGFLGSLATLFPEEAAALTHGDLWSGNYLANQTGKPVLIDPAVSYAHREMDLAMSHLFGGFAPKFYEAYEEAFPLVPGFERRMGYYQLYYLMVHVNLFGGGYWQQVKSIIAPFQH